jgi:hypothetical protein
MPFEKFVVGPYKSGLVTAAKPFYIPEDAFAKLLNAYVWRGRVRKRPGAITVSNTGTEIQRINKSRLRINLGNTTGGGAFNNGGVAVPGNVWKIGQAFSVGDVFFTVYQAAGNMYRTSGVGASTFDTATGMVSITGAPATTAVYYYPSEPVMGFFNQQVETINDEPTWAWDTQFAYEFNTVNDGWERLAGETAAGDARWNSTIDNDSAFFWAVNWYGVLVNQRYQFVTNNNPAETRYMRYFDPATTQWNSWRPVYQFDPLAVAPTLHINAALLIIAFSDRLLIVNTVEEQSVGPAIRFRNRIRYSKAFASPIDNTITNVYPFNSFEPGQGGITDAPTDEAIIGAEFLRDRLIIYFEDSIFELAQKKQDNVNPFIWRKINTGQGAESTFSTIPFDNHVLAIGRNGVYACAGTSVQRVDSQIPDEVFGIHNDIEGVKRVHGIRDYFTEMAYWTFPNFVDNPTYPTRILAFNYESNSWAIWSDSITTFGYFQNPTTRGVSISDQALFRQVIAGNQQGYTFLLERDIPINTAALQITDIDIASAPTITLTVISNNLDVTSAEPNDTDFIKLDNIVGITGLNGKIYQMQSFPTPNTLTITENGAVSGTYKGGGTIQRVSRINMLTKDFNPYTPQGRNVYINKVNFLVDNQGGVDPGITLDYYISTSILSTVAEAQISGALVGTSVLELAPYTLVPYEATQQQFWHSVYFQMDGEFIQFNVYWTDEQMKKNTISLLDFQLHSMVIHARPESVYSG